MKNASAFIAGLEGIVAARTYLSSVDGEAGELLIAGYPVEAMAPKASFEEILFVLWRGKRPSASETAQFREELARSRTLHKSTLDILQAAALEKLPAMDALRMACATLSLSREKSPRKSDADPDSLLADARLAVAAFPSIVASYDRMLRGLKPVAPRTELSHAANFLYMLEDKIPSAERTRGLETYLNTVVDHGLNNSTFTARVMISTETDLVSAITGAVGSLKGPLHGGAPGPALDLVFEIASIDRAESILWQKIKSGERLMGFGHRIYRTRDPRAEVLSLAAKEFFENGGDSSLYELACGVEKIAVRVLEEHKPGRKLQTNVEFFTALLLHGLGMPTHLFSPIFAISRVGGWTAHCLEQLRGNRIYRPQSEYIGPRHSTW